MDGKEFARWVETELSKRGIKKGDFYKAVGVSATALYNWRNGTTPALESVTAIEDYFGMKFSGEIIEDIPGMDSDTAELLEQIRNRQDLRVLLRSAKDVPPSSVYELVSKLEKLKEDAND